MPDESLPARRKIGLERRYDGRQYAADALTRRRNRVFRHRQKKAENANPGKVSRGEFTTEDTENAEIIHRLHRCSQAPVARLYYRGANVADGAQRRGYRVRRRHTCRYNKRQTLFFVQKRQERLVASVLHFFVWNEMEGGRVHHVTLAGRRLRVGKDIAEVGVTSFGVHLAPLHIVRSIQALAKEIFRDRFAECGKADVAVEFVERSEEWFAGNDIDIDARALVVPELILERRLGATLPHDGIFLGL